MKTKQLLEYLASRGGCIVCTSVLSVKDINKARDEERLSVVEDGIGYVWIPPYGVLRWSVEYDEIIRPML